ncbi:MAG: hypothetical protein JWM57_2379 [Phycisphaerales bacterium]|nr:hypothetical protein [Phycisphaerales bacterium]
MFPTVRLQRKFVMCILSDVVGQAFRLDGPYLIETPMKIQSSALRKASARVEALEQRSMFSGEIDHAMGANGLVNVHDASGAAVISSAIAVQADGKTVVAGHLYKTPNTAVITRYNTNGSVDTTFGTNGYATVANVKAYNIDNVTVLSNGKIFVGGQTYLRLTAAGKLDTSFSGDGVQPSALAADRKTSDLVLPDGSYFELGNTPYYNSETPLHDRLYKFKADGTLDKSFASNGSFDMGSVGSVGNGGVAVDSSGRVFVSFNDHRNGLGGKWAVVRLTPAGKIDTTYGTGGVAKTDEQYLAAGKHITVLKDGRALLMSDFTNEHGSTNDVDGFSADGKSSFRVRLTDGGGYFFAEKIIQASDGSVYFGGYHLEGTDLDGGYTGLNFAAVQHFKADLTFDSSYSPDKDAVGGFTLAAARTNYADFALNASGQAVLLGQSGDQANPLRSDFVRLTAAGTSNHTYVSVSGSVLTVNGSAANDHIIAYHEKDGDVSNSGYYDTVVRFDDDGVLLSADAAFYDDVYVNGGYPAPSFSKIVVNLGDGNDVFDGSGLNVPVLVHGNNGNDKIIGTVFSDSLYGDAGTDTIVGNGGTDTIVT